MSEETQFLINKKVRVAPVTRQGGWLDRTSDGRDHDGKFMYTGAFREYTVPLRKSGGLVDPFEGRKEEREFFEKELSFEPGALSPNKRKENYWFDFRVRVTKNGMELDLSNPIDALKYKVLKANPEIATEWEKRFSAGVKFVIIDGDRATEDKVKISDMRKECYVWLDSATYDEMYDTLRIIGKQQSRNASNGMLQTQLDELITNPKTLTNIYSVIKDSDFRIKAFIAECLEKGALVKFDKTKYKVRGTDDTDALANNMNELVDFLKAPKNSDIYMNLKVKVNDGNSDAK